MTKDEAIKELQQIPQHIGGDCDGYELRALSMAIDALEQADKLWGDNYDEWYERYVFNMNTLNNYATQANKYKWHDLRKNAEDLPPFDKVVLVKYEFGYDYVYRTSTYTLDFFGIPTWADLNLIQDGAKAIMWMYIPESEEE